MNIIKAQSSGDINAVNKYTEQLYQNIEQRAEYLANINPFWDKNTLVNFMNYFTSMTIQEINAYLSKQYKESINIFDRILNFSSEMGDYVAQGITNYLIYSSRRPITL
jgi:flagellar biosynthesis chaperone FliJ